MSELEPIELVSIKAGIVELISNKLISHKTKGTLALVSEFSSGGEQRIYLRWRPRASDNDQTAQEAQGAGTGAGAGSGPLAFDSLVTDHDFSIKKINCPDGRIFLFENISLKQKNFFWIQESLGEGLEDEEIIETFTQIFVDCKPNTNNNNNNNNTNNSITPAINQPQPSNSSHNNASKSNNTNNNNSQSNNNNLLNILKQLAGGGLEYLNNSNEIINKFSLVELLDPERVKKVFSALALSEEEINLLNQFLPANDPDRSGLEGLITHLRSAQLQQTLTRLDSIASSSQFGQLLASFSLPTNTSNIGVEGFLEAIQKSVDQKK